MAFARWDPIRDLLAIQQRLDRFAPGPAGWSPPVDLLETTDAYLVMAELPGVIREDLTGVSPSPVSAASGWVRNIIGSSAAMATSAGRSTFRFRLTRIASPRICTTAS